MTNPRTNSEIPTLENSITEYLSDNRGNRAYIAYFGSADNARNALESLVDCDDCLNCSDCSRCSGCSRCSFLIGKVAADGTDGPPPVPVIAEIHRAIYVAASAPGALHMGHWHCGTTRCRAGWVVALAGEPGFALERFYNTELAAMMIYDASDLAFKINPGRFYDTSEKTLADMKALAERGTDVGVTK